MSKENKQIKNTGQLRNVLAKAAVDVLNGELDLEKADMLHKLSRNITDSLYSETKIAMFNKEHGLKTFEIGSLPLSDQEKDTELGN